MFQLFRRLFLLVCLLTLVGCEAPLYGTDVTGADFAHPLNLTDHTGQRRSMDDFKDKVVVMFFGFTHCPDVCPTTMNDLKQTMQLLGEDANKVQVLFVTVDPLRDTTEVLAQFVPFFDERFIGLTGTQEEVKANLDAYKVFASAVPNKDGKGYSIDHSAGLYVFDQTGAVRLYMQHGQKPAEIASDIKQIL